MSYSVKVLCLRLVGYVFLFSMAILFCNVHFMYAKIKIESVSRSYYTVDRDVRIKVLSLLNDKYFKPTTSAVKAFRQGKKVLKKYFKIMRYLGISPFPEADDINVIFYSRRLLCD